MIALGNISELQFELLGTRIEPKIHADITGRSVTVIYLPQTGKSTDGKIS
jgi:hypothetical protein